MSLIAEGCYRFDEFELETSRRRLTRNGERIAISPKSFEVLLYLVLHAGKVVLKDELLTAVWPDSFVEESNLTQHIFWLRKALGDRATCIVTIPGRGYEFTAKVQTLPGPAAPPVPQAGDAQDALPISHVSGEFHLHRSLETTRVIVEETTHSEARIAAPAQGWSVHWRWIAVSAAAILLTVTIWGVWYSRDRVVPGDHQKVVLADFVNTTGNPVFDRTLDTLLATEVKQSPYLLVASRDDTRKGLKMLGRVPDTPLTPEIARDVCVRLNNQAVLNGTIANQGDAYAVTLAAVDCASGEKLVETRAKASGQDAVLKAVDVVSAQMRRRLGEKLSQGKTEAQLQVVPTTSLEALRLYTDAHWLHAANKCAQAIPLYERAVVLDPKFAIAWGALGNCYDRVQRPDDARAATQKAYDLRDVADAPYRFWIVNAYNARFTGNLSKALSNLEEWTAAYPQQGDPLANLGNLESYLGRPTLAIEAEKRAIALRPSLARDEAIVDLAQAQMHAGQIEEATATCEGAIASHYENPQLHVLLFDLGFLGKDSTLMNEQVAWAAANGDEPRVIMEEARLAMAQGRLKAGTALWMKAADQYGRQGSGELATHAMWNLARTEAELGEVAEARALVRAQGQVKDRTDSVVNLLIARAETGDPARAEAEMNEALPRYPEDTDWHGFHIPQIESAVALARNQPGVALDALKGALPYDLRDYEAPSRRGLAYLAAHQPELAAGEFEKVIQHPGVDPVSYYVPLAHLGLGRARAMAGDSAGARVEYEVFFAEWKEADADLQLLKQARSEYAAIR